MVTCYLAMGDKTPAIDAAMVREVADVVAYYKSARNSYGNLIQEAKRNG